MIVKEEDTMIFSGQAVEEIITEGTHQEEDHLKLAKAKMYEVTEENKKLKLTLSHMMKNYQSLKTSFDGIFKQDDRPIKVNDSSPKPDESEDRPELVCRLSLGSFSGQDCKKQEEKSNQENKNLKELVQADGLELGLEHKFHPCDSGDATKNSSSENNSVDESKEDQGVEAKGSFKSLKSARSGTSDEILELNPVKKPRVSVRAVCDTQTMNDGCQWRKYGQKTAKGNPCPRAYYRCTASTSCPVRKQVQRCADNMAILITTYEGTHNHPLPPSATTMASATTSAAAMLNCGSSTSSPPSQGVFSTSSSTTASNFNTFNFSSSNSTLSSPYSFSRASISTSQSHPTVILDLTPPSHTSIPYNKYSNSTSLYSSMPRSSSICLNFSSVPHSDSGSLGVSRTLFHTESHALADSQPCVYNKSIQEDVLSIDGIGAAAKAITRDPKFQTALATAVASLLGNGGGVNNVQETNSGQNLKWGENFGLSFAQPSSRNGVTACATRYLSKYLESLNPQQK